MIPPLLADIDNASIIQGLSTLATLALTVVLLVRGTSSKVGERQIEPTSLHAITSELKSQTITLNSINRETGELKTQIKAVDAKIDAQSAQVDNAFRRINAISTESASVKDRLADHLADHREGRFNA